MEVSNKTEWFRHLMHDREDFFDVGFTAIYIDSKIPMFLMFWKCLSEGEGPWLSSPNQ